MSHWSPATLPREWLVGIIAVYLIGLGYLIVVAQQLLLGVVLGAGMLLLYFLWRLLVAIEAIADAQQTLANQ